MDALPKIGDPYPVTSAETVLVVETATPTISEEELGQTVTVCCPFFPWDSGYCRRNLDVVLTSTQATTLKGILLGLEKQEACLINGRPVSNPVDAIRWMLENVKSPRNLIS